MSVRSDRACPVLIVDDEAPALRSVETALLTGGITDTITCQDSRKVAGIMAEKDVSVLLLDLFMPHIGGKEILATVVEEYPQVPVIIVTGANDVETAVSCLGMGAFDYIVKPAEKDRLVTSVARALEIRCLRIENRALSSRLMSPKLENPDIFREFVTVSDKMLAVFGYIEAIAKSSEPVLITGQTGTGKELIARAVHECSRPGKPFVAVNVAGLGDELFADTLFGHRKGAFTGADEPRKGMILRAAAGTLFLDEIGDLGQPSQVKLLRMLQEREFVPLGADMAIGTDARIVVATNQDLEDRLKSGDFRKDLYYRLQTHRIVLPPLRERMEDIPCLVDHFLEAAAKELGRERPSVPPQLNKLLSTYHFPGNVRELRALIYDAVSRHGSGVLGLKAIRERLPVGLASATSADSNSQSESLVFGRQLPTIREVSELVVAEALKRSDGNQTIAARLLGISQQALSKRAQQARKDSDGVG